MRNLNGFGDEISKWINEPKNFLVIHGPPGSGKTYMCAALLELIPPHKTIRGYKERGVYTRLREEIAESNNKGDYLKSIKHMFDDDINIIDDIGQCKITEWNKEVLMDIIDLCYNDLRPLIITTNLNQSQMEQNYSEALRSRIFAKENSIVDFGNMNDLREEGL